MEDLDLIIYIALIIMSAVGSVIKKITAKKKSNSAPNQSDDDGDSTLERDVMSQPTSYNDIFEAPAYKEDPMASLSYIQLLNHMNEDEIRRHYPNAYYTYMVAQKAQREMQDKSKKPITTNVAPPANNEYDVRDDDDDAFTIDFSNHNDVRNVVIASEILSRKY